MKRVLLASVVAAALAWAIAYVLEWADRRQTDGPAAPPPPVERERPLEELSRRELYQRAQRANIPGRSTMSKEALIEALRAL
jgi:DNA end-binding protein Ku